MGILGLEETWRTDRPADPLPAGGAPGPEPAPDKLPRRFGEFLLTSLLGQDALGRVYRGLLLGETGEFVRVRILDSPHLSRDRLFEAVRRTPAARVSPHRPRGEKLGTIRGVPYLAWSEMHGWTLDGLTRDLRRRGRRLPVEHVLLIVDGMARALETRGPHGVPWPGFVSISRDGEVRVSGFGLAPAILPALRIGAIADTVGPYVAPEVQEEGVASAEGDVYSLAAVALELLTDSPAPFPGLGRGAGADRLFPNELGRLLRVALARKRQRFGSAGDLRRELGQFMVTSRHLPSSFHFARFLRDLDAGRAAPGNARGAADPSGVPPGPDAGMAEVSLVPALEEAEIDAVLQSFWGEIEKSPPASGKP